MPISHLLVHVVWRTWRRRPLIRPELEKDLHAVIDAKCRELRCPVIALGGTDNHVHLLVRLHPTVPLCRLAGEAKGSSSHVATHVLQPNGQFRWQEGYWAATICPEEISNLVHYIDQQREHHKTDRVLEHWEPEEAP
jgi:REP element-mobilizing transposase RayT